MCATLGHCTQNIVDTHCTALFLPLIYDILGGHLTYPLQFELLLFSGWGEMLNSCVAYSSAHVQEGICYRVRTSVVKGSEDSHGHKQKFGEENPVMKIFLIRGGPTF